MNADSTVLNRDQFLNYKLNIWIYFDETKCLLSFCCILFMNTKRTPDSIHLICIIFSTIIVFFSIYNWAAECKILVAEIGKQKVDSNLIVKICNSRFTLRRSTTQNKQYFAFFFKPCHERLFFILANILYLPTFNRNKFYFRSW